MTMIRGDDSQREPAEDTPHERHLGRLHDGLQVTEDWGQRHIQAADDNKGEARLALAAEVTWGVSWEQVPMGAAGPTRGQYLCALARRPQATSNGKPNCCLASRADIPAHVCMGSAGGCKPKPNQVRHLQQHDE